MSTHTPCVLTVIAPCRNEEENIAVLVRRTLSVFDALAIVGELVLIDDGSWDATWAVIDGISREEGRVRGVRHGKNRGIAAAWRSGLQASTGRLVCLIDADLQNRPEDIAQLYHAYRESEADIVQGVRRPVCTLHRHRLFTRGLNSLLNLAFRARLKDNKSGFLLCDRDTLAVILYHRFAYRYFQAFVGVAAVARNRSIKEIHTTFDPRTRGQSFLSRFPIRTSIRIIWELAKFRTETWLEVVRARRQTNPGLDFPGAVEPLAECQ